MNLLSVKAPAIALDVYQARRHDHVLGRLACEIAQRLGEIQDKLWPRFGNRG
jgi:ribosomal protein L13